MQTSGTSRDFFQKSRPRGDDAHRGLFLFRVLNPNHYVEPIANLGYGLRNVLADYK